MTAIQTLVDLLAGRRAAASLAPREWDGVIGVARAEALLGTLAYRMADADLPASVSALFTDLRAAADVATAQALWEAEMARRALAPIGIDFVLLKGAAYAAAGLPNARGRQIGDLDILVARSDLDEAEAALLRAGWEWVKADAYDDAYYRQHMHELPPLIHKARDRMIDVHHTILPLTHRSTPDAAAMLRDAIPLPFRGGVRGGGRRYSAKANTPRPNPSPEREGLIVLAPADMACHCAAHLFADGDLAGGLRNLWDFHCLVESLLDTVMDGSEPPDVIWAYDNSYGRLRERAQHHGLLYHVDRAMRLAGHVFGANRNRLSASDALFVRRLLARDDWGGETRKALRLAFYIRSHWLRMPPPMLARHLWAKWRKR